MIHTINSSNLHPIIPENLFKIFYNFQKTFHTKLRLFIAKQQAPFLTKTIWIIHKTTSDSHLYWWCSFTELSKRWSMAREKGSQRKRIKETLKEDLQIESIHTAIFQKKTKMISFIVICSLLKIISFELGDCSLVVFLSAFFDFKWIDDKLWC